jgi:hypothetical protein
MEMKKKQQQKRDFLKKVVYVVPTILTLTAIPSFASAGSGYSSKPVKPKRR